MSEATINPTKYVQTPLTGQSPEMEKLGGMAILNLVQNEEPKKEEVVVEDKKEEPVVEDNFKEEEPEKVDEIPVVEEKVEKTSVDVIEEKVNEAIAEAVVEAEKAPELPASRKAAQSAFAAKDREIKTLAKQVKELEPLAAKAKELEEIVAKAPKVDPEIEARLAAVEARNKELETQAETYKKELYATNVEKSDEFKQLVTDPFTNSIQPVIRAITKATNGVISKATIDDIVVTQDPSERHEKLRALREQLDPADYQELAAMIPEYRKVIENRSKLTANAQQTVALKQREQEQGMQKAREEYQKNLKAELPLHDSRLKTEVFAGIEADETLEEKLNQASKNLENFNWYESTVPQQAAVKAALKNFPIALTFAKVEINKLKEEKVNLENRVKELESATKKLTKASPAAGGSTTGAQRVNTEPEEVGKLDGAGLVGMLRSA